MATHFDLHSPERGWPPLLDWLRDEGIPADDLVALTVDESGLATGTFYAYDRHGEPVIDRGPGEPERATYQRSGMVLTMPPLHPDRGA